MKQVAGSLKLFLVQYHEVAAFAQFGPDLDAATKQTLNRGECLQELLKQRQYALLPVKEQVPLIYSGVKGYLDRVPVERVTEYEAKFLAHLRINEHLLLGQIVTPYVQTHSDCLHYMLLFHDFSPLLQVNQFHACFLQLPGPEASPVFSNRSRNLE